MSLSEGPRKCRRASLRRRDGTDDMEEAHPSPSALPTQERNLVGMRVSVVERSWRAVHKTVKLSSPGPSTSQSTLTVVKPAGVEVSLIGADGSMLMSMLMLRIQQR